MSSCLDFRRMLHAAEPNALFGHYSVDRSREHCYFMTCSQAETMCCLCRRGSRESHNLNHESFELRKPEGLELGEDIKGH